MSTWRVYDLRSAVRFDALSATLDGDINRSQEFSRVSSVFQVPTSPWWWELALTDVPTTPTEMGMRRGNRIPGFIYPEQGALSSVTSIVI